MLDLKNTVGIVQTEYYTFEEPVMLDIGEEFSPVTVAFEAYGELNERKDNAILILHALSGDAHAAGFNFYEDKHPGWWDSMIGPGKAFDTDKYFVVCSNFLGSCNGTTGPSSSNPHTNRAYGLDFPMVTIADMVKVQKRLMDYLGVRKLITAGGSMGGMQAMEWASLYPEMVKGSVIIASSARTSAQAIAYNEVGRKAIFSDPDFHGGNYYGGKVPSNGLAVARMLAHITYLSDEAMEKKFGRRLQGKNFLDFNFDANFQVESYLNYQGKSFVDRFDANSYLYITKAMDYFDMPHKYGSLSEAFRKCDGKFLVISFSSDLLFPPEESEYIVKSLINTGKDVSYCKIDMNLGHDSFLIEVEQQTKIIKGFLSSIKS